MRVWGRNEYSKRCRTLALTIFVKLEGLSISFIATTMRKGKDIIQIASYLWGFPILIEAIKTNQRQVVLSKNQLFINNSIIGGSCCESANGVRRKFWTQTNIKLLLSFKYLKYSHVFATTCESYVFCRNFCNACITTFFLCKLTNTLPDERIAFVRSPKGCLLVPPWQQLCVLLPELFLLFSVLCEKCISHQIGISLTVGDFSFHLCNCASAEVLGLLAQSQGGKHVSDN